MPLSPTATETDVDLAFNANLPPFRSVDQAQTFLQACVRKLARPVESGAPRSNLRFSHEYLNRLREEADRWLRANDPSLQGDTAAYLRTHADFTEFRD